jgi:hypothetical protein
MPLVGRRRGSVRLCRWASRAVRHTQLRVWRSSVVLPFNRNRDVSVGVECHDRPIDLAAGGGRRDGLMPLRGPPQPRKTQPTQKRSFTSDAKIPS